MSQASPYTVADRPRRGRPRHDTPSADYLARKDLILSRAAEVFASKGYETATLDDVAEALDMRKASLYHYVRSKSDLLAELFTRALDAGTERLHQAAKIVDPRERLVRIITVFVDEMADHPGLVAAFADHRPRFDEERDAHLRAKDEELVDIVSSAVREAMAAGILPPTDVRYGALAIIGMVSSVHKWFDPARDEHPAVIAENFVRLLSLSVSAR